ncbi:hypothetical protein F5X96DRAFT_672344 [Biscogniauxia mediterranea]|nr:hypothetical protein F5X96DRAFT_672344 [Biscogniauxia mediterranea]
MEPMGGDKSIKCVYGYEPWRLEKLRALKAQYDPYAPFFSVNLVYAHDEEEDQSLASSFASATSSNATHPITRVSFDESYVTFAELPLPEGGGVQAACTASAATSRTSTPWRARQFFDVRAMMIDLYQSYGSFDFPGNNRINP